MADELKRVGLVFKADGAADFQKTMQQKVRNKLENYLMKLQSLQIKLRRMRLKSKLLNRNMTII